MNFNGDLSKYHPADAIMFLSQLNLNGMFSIAENQRLITLNFRNGLIIDAHSKRGDAKILQALIYHRRATTDQIRHIRRIQTETGLPIRAILAKLDLFPLSTVKEILLVGMQEVLLEMFLLESGSFHFTDTPVDHDGAETQLDARMLAIRVAAQSDEFRDFEKSVVSLDRELSVAAGSPEEQLPADTQVVLRLAANCRTIRQLLERSPFDSHAVMEIISAQLKTGAIVLPPANMEKTPEVNGMCVDPLFGAFRQALKTLMLTDDPLKRIEALVNYCKRFYDGVLILTAKDGQLVHCKQIFRSNGPGFIQRSSNGQMGRVDQDAVLNAVHHSGVGFFGEHFPSKLLENLSGGMVSGECALIPVVTRGAVLVFLYVFSRKKFSGLSPQHYLELLSWMNATPRKAPVVSGTNEDGPMAGQSANKAIPVDQQAPARLVSLVEDLPPLPALVSRALELLSDPDVAVEKIEAVIGKDQSLVSKLIRVSNSALYGGLQRVESLQQALTRLGANTTKGLVVAASMQGYFLKTNPGLQTWAQSLWQHAAECGLAARRIASAIGHEDPEKAFVGGVVHDIGKLVILLAGDDAYRRIQNLIRKASLPTIEAEQRIMGTDHVAIGVQLMEKWKMPPSARWCVQYHHRVDDAGDHRLLAAIANYANHLSHCYGAKPQPVTPEEQAAIDALVQALGLSPEQNDTLVELVSADFQDAALY